MDLTQLCKDLEHFETPLWAVNAILDKEILIGTVFDPCCGTGIMVECAKSYNYKTVYMDINDWGYCGNQMLGSFFDLGKLNVSGDFTVFMNPPFSKACEFVEHSFNLGASKVVMFQRFAFWESKKRRKFWEKYKPSRVYICGDRADCWRHDIPKDQRGSSSPTAHAWFVFDRDYQGDTVLNHVWKQ